MGDYVEALCTELAARESRGDQPGNPARIAAIKAELARVAPPAAAEAKVVAAPEAKVLPKPKRGQ